MQDPTMMAASPAGTAGTSGTAGSPAMLVRSPSLRPQLHSMHSNGMAHSAAPVSGSQVIMAVYNRG